MIYDFHSKASVIYHLNFNTVFKQCTLYRSKELFHHFSSNNRENLEKLPDARHYFPSSHCLPQPFFLMRQNHFIYLHLSQSLQFRYRTFMHLCVQYSCETIPKCSAKRAGSDQPLTFRYYIQRNLEKMEAVSFIYSYMRNML